MTLRELKSDNLGQNEDGVGNNAAFTCPECGNVFIVSGMLHRDGRPCTSCGKTTAFVEGGVQQGGRAWLEPT